MTLTPQKLVQLAKYPNLESTWYFIAAATLSVCNQPQEIPKVYHYALKLAQHQHRHASGANQNHLELAKSAIERSHTLADLSSSGDFTNPLYSEIENSTGIDNTQNLMSQMEISSKLREAILKSLALGGIPKAINTLMLLKNSTPLPLRATQPSRDFSIEKTQEIRERGAKYWKKVYEKVSDRVTNQMHTAYPDLWYFTKNHIYGPLLSFTDVLPPSESSLVIISCLIPQEVNPQLKGHLRGAVNAGCSAEEIASCREMSLTIGEWFGIKWKEPVAKL